MRGGGVGVGVVEAVVGLGEGTEERGHVWASGFSFGFGFDVVFH